MSHYDPKLLRKLAEKLDAQARTAVVGGIVAGAVTGSLFGYAAALMFSTPYSLVLPGLMVGSIIGIFAGRRKAHALKLQAQMAYCQIKIEENGHQNKPA
jgi:F0F1-type ATP synthase assembly protein I